MDTTAVLIFLAVLSLVALVTAALAYCSSRETDFDEVMKTKRQELEKPPPVKAKKEKKEKKFKKKKTSTVTLPTPAEHTDQSDHDKHKMVQYELEPQVFDMPDEASIAAKKRNSTKSGKVEQPTKSILHNKHEKSLVQSAPVKVKNVITRVPLDDVELHHFRVRRDSEASLKKLDHEDEDEPIIVKMESAKTNKESGKGQKGPMVNETKAVAETMKVTRVTPVAEAVKVTKAPPAPEAVKVTKAPPAPEAVKITKAPPAPEAVKITKTHEAVKVTKAPEAVKVTKAAPVTETVKVTKVAPLTSEEQTPSPTPTNKKSKKKKSEEKTLSVPNIGGGESFMVNGDINYNLMEVIKEATLTPDEVQSLVDLLLLKQGSVVASTFQNSKKAHKNDPTIELRKQIQERDNIIVQERANVHALMQRVELTKGEGYQQQQRAERLEGQLQMQAAENQALMMRMQQSHEQHILEMNKLHQQAELGKHAETEITRLLDDNRKLQERLVHDVRKVQDTSQTQTKMLMEQLNEATLKINTLEDAKMMVEHKHGKMEEQLNKLKNSEQRGNESMSKKVHELTEEIKRKEQEMAKIIAANKKAENDHSVAERRLAEASEGFNKQIHGLQGRLTELENINKTKEHDLQASQKVVVELQTKLKEKPGDGHIADISQLQEQVKTLQEECSTSHHQIKESEASKQELSAEVSRLREELAKTSVTHETVQRSSGDDSGSLQKELEERAREISELKEQLAALHEKNQESRQAEVNKLTQALNELTAKGQGMDQEIEKLLRDNQALRSDTHKVMESERRSSSLWEQLQQVQQTLVEKDTALQKQITETTTLKQSNETLKETVGKLHETEAQYKQLEDKVAQLQTSLSDKEAEVTAFHEELGLLRRQNQNLQQQKDELVEGQLGSEEELQREVEKLQQELQTARDEMASLTERLSSSSPQEKILEGQLSSANQELVHLKEELHQVKDTLKLKEAQVAERDAELGNLRQVQESTVQQLNEASSSTAQLRAELEQLAKNTEMNAVVSGQIDELHREISALKSEKSSLEKSLEQQINNVQNTDLATELAEALQKEEKLHGQVQHYQTVLAETEAILSRLQNSVDSEEKKWREKVRQKDEELLKTHTEVHKLGEELKAVRGSREMELRVAELEGLLATSETERDQYKQEVQEIQRLRQSFEGEEKRVKELTSQTVKLNAQLKMGQDALHQEQHLVTQLQEELAKRSLLNGANNLTEVEELKTKLENLQKRLEHEEVTNRQLTQRLASYGCFTATS